MEIEYFNPISKPKALKSPEKIKQLDEKRKLTLVASNGRKREEYTKE